MLLNPDNHPLSHERTLMPRLILQMSWPSGMTEAVVTSAPKRVRVSVMQVVSISSDPSAIGTSTRLDILRAEDAKARLAVVVVLCERNPCDPLPNARNAARTILIAMSMATKSRRIKSKWETTPEHGDGGCRKIPHDATVDLPCLACRKS